MLDPVIQRAPSKAKKSNCVRHLVGPADSRQVLHSKKARARDSYSTPLSIKLRLTIADTDIPKFKTHAEDERIPPIPRTSSAAGT